MDEMAEESERSEPQRRHDNTQLSLIPQLYPQTFSYDLFAGTSITLDHHSRIHVNYYDVLCISRTASLQEIKTAYHRSLLLHHPDKSASRPGARETGNSSLPTSCLPVEIETIKAAYAALSSPKSRREHDALIDGRDGMVSRPAQFVSLEEFEEDATKTGVWSYPCRCGGVYKITEDDMEKNIHMVGCDGCSETVWVGFEVVEE
ncbi:hypothetical protein L218DRAFT_1076636 [Marasmius fiardii PR-910]|nr:hypothetical protein L218DRAFT_1076636 [Marasmius fiardii PR-910]